MMHEISNARVIGREDVLSPEFRARGERVAEREGLEFREAVVNSEIAAAAVIGTWGKHLMASEIDGEIERHLSGLGVDGVGESHAGRTGFKQSWWGGRLEYDELLPFQMELTRRGLLGATHSLGITPGKLVRFGVASTTPFSMKLAEYVSVSLDMSPTVKAEVSAAACNSAGLLFDQQLLEAHLRDYGMHAIVSYENALSFRYPLFDSESDHPDASTYSRGITDRIPLSFFSDLLTAVVYDPARFRVLARTTFGIKDEKQVLGAVNTVPFEGEEVEGYNGLVRRSEDGYVSYLPDPRSDQGAHMDPFGTTKLMLGVLKVLADRFKKKADDSGIDLASVNHVLVHHPSAPLHGRVRELFGFQEDLMPWGEEHVNAPACTWGLEMARVLPELEVGDRMMQVFFGAGAIGQIQLLEVV